MAAPDAIPSSGLQLEAGTETIQCILAQEMKERSMLVVLLEGLGWKGIIRIAWTKSSSP